MTTRNEALLAVLAVVQHRLTRNDPRSAEFDLLSRRAAASVKELKPADLVTFIAQVMTLGLELGNIPEGKCDHADFADLVAAACRGVEDEMGQAPVEAPGPGRRNLRCHLKVV